MVHIDHIVDSPNRVDNYVNYVCYVVSKKMLTT